MALKLHIGIPESCSEGPAATIALPHQTHDDHDHHWSSSSSSSSLLMITIALPHKTHDDHGGEDEGYLGQDNNEC